MKYLLLGYLSRVLWPSNRELLRRLMRNCAEQRRSQDREKEPRSYADAPNSLQRMVPCSIWTPSWSHCTCWWTTGGSSSTLRSRRELALRPCLPTPRSSPWPSSPSSGPASEVSEISGALL